MLNINNLDKFKTYIGIQIGDNLIAKAIQELSKDEIHLPANKIASHVFAMYYKDGWKVAESHIRTNGVKISAYEDWIKKETPEHNNVFQRDLNIEVLEFWARFNPHYSLGEIAELAVSEIANKELGVDCAGLTCSEYCALADKKFKICYQFNLPPHNIKPCHFQLSVLKGENL